MVKKRLTFAVGDGGHRLGEAHHNAKLTDKEVEEIRDIHERGEMGYKKLAKKYNVHRATIKDICTFRKRSTTPAGYKTVIEQPAATWAVRPTWWEPPIINLKPDKDFMFEDSDLFT